MGKTVEIKSPDSLQAYTMILFLRRDVISVLIISCSETQWGIWGTFRFSGIPKKPILNPFSTISSIIESFVMSFQFSLKFLMLPATNSDVPHCYLVNLVFGKSIALLSCPSLPLSRALLGRMQTFWSIGCRCWWLGLFEWVYVIFPTVWTVWTDRIFN